MSSGLLPPQMQTTNLCQLWCLLEGEANPFQVIANVGQNMFELKKLIQAEEVALRSVDASDIVLWKLVNPMEIKPVTTLSNRLPQFPSEFFVNLGEPTDTISSYFLQGVPKNCLHIIVGRPAKSTHEDLPATASIAHLSKDEPPPWLDEMHEKLWGKRELFGEIFRTAKLTQADFIELQLELERIDSSRSSPSYAAREVLKVKAKFLREKSGPMGFAFLDSDSLVPSVTVSPVPDDAMDIDPNAEADPVPQSDNCRYIFDDAAKLSMGPSAVFPCTIRYMDLTILDLKKRSRVPHLTFIRDEWDIMSKVFNRRKKGMDGSAVFTGSPGIGKTCFLYYILILCLIRSQTVVFQDQHRNVFLITDTVLPQRRKVEVESDDILTLVDADGKCCIPHKYILRSSNLRILLTSSPRPRKDRKWLIQDVRDQGAAYVMSPWRQEEWLVASLFIVEKDITLRRFWETAHICGFVPRDFLSAVESPDSREDVRMKILDAITTCQDIKEAISSVAVDLRFPHRAFVVYPLNERRSLAGCLVEPISEYAMDTIIKVLDDRSADAAFNLYRSIQGSYHAATFRGKIWERKVHRYFRQTFTTPSLDDYSTCRTASKSFIIRSLDDDSKQEWDLSNVAVKHFDFGPLQMLAGELTERVAAGESIYLQTTSDNFASLDSIIYQPPDSLVGIQITIASTHPIKTKGLSALRWSLKPNDESKRLSPLLPTVEQPWTLLFVVPKPMETSFIRQDITGVGYAGWNQKTKQYVLGLDQCEVFSAQ